MAELVALIEENLVRQYWPREDYVLTRRYSGLHRKPDSCKGSFVYGRLYSATGRWPGDSPIVPVPNALLGLGDLYGDIRAHRETRTSRRVFEIEPHVKLLNRYIPMSLGNALGEGDCHSRVRSDGGLKRGYQFETAFEHVGVQKVEQSFVVIVFDIDCVALKGHSFGADVKPDKNGIADDRRFLPLPRAVRSVEVQVLDLSGSLVLGVEIKQNAVRATARIIGDP